MKYPNITIQEAINNQKAGLELSDDGQYIGRVKEFQKAEELNKEKPYYIHADGSVSIGEETYPASLIKDLVKEYEKWKQFFYHDKSEQEIPF